MDETGRWAGLTRRTGWVCRWVSRQTRSVRTLNAPVTKVDRSGDGVTVETEDGAETRFSEEYWDIIESVVDGAYTGVEVGDGAPAFARLPDGSDVVIVPQFSDE